MTTTMVTQQQIEGLPPAPPDQREQYAHRCLDAIRDLVDRGDPFTADQVRALAGSPPNRYITGRIFHRARQAGLIHPSHTYVLSQSHSRRNAPVMVWNPVRSTP